MSSQRRNFHEQEIFQLLREISPRKGRLTKVLSHLAGFIIQTTSATYLFYTVRGHVYNGIKCASGCLYYRRIPHGHIWPIEPTELPFDLTTPIYPDFMDNDSEISLDGSWMKNRLLPILEEDGTRNIWEIFPFRFTATIDTLTISRTDIVSEEYSLDLLNWINFLAAITGSHIISRVVYEKSYLPEGKTTGNLSRNWLIKFSDIRETDPPTHTIYFPEERLEEFKKLCEWYNYFIY